jgi:hypothetical protein
VPGQRWSPQFKDRGCDTVLPCQACRTTQGKMTNSYGWIVEWWLEGETVGHRREIWPNTTLSTWSYAALNPTPCGKKSALCCMSCHVDTVVKRWQSLLVFGRESFRILAGTLVILTEVFLDFLQPLQETAATCASVQIISNSLFSNFHTYYIVILTESVEETMQKTPCSLVGSYQYFQGTHCLHNQGRKLLSTYQKARRHNPQHHNISNKHFTKLNSVALVHKRTIPTERPPLSAK